jgi:hypothetical protein
MSYTEGEGIPRWFAWLGMVIALLMPYVVAVMIAKPRITNAWGFDLSGLSIALISIPYISVVAIIVAYLWYHNDYWYKDVEHTVLNPMVLIIIIGYPIAFTLTANSSMGVYFVGALLIAIIGAMFYRWEPRAPTTIGSRMGLFWAGVTAVVVLLISSLDILINHGFNAWLSALLSPTWYQHVIIYSYALWLINQFHITNTLQLIPTIGLFAFVVGFSEEAWARLSIPMMAKYLDNLTLSVWWLGTTWLSLHAVVIAYEVGLSALPINLLILSIISMFIFYVFAKTGDYVATAIAHGFYDLMVSLGLVGLILGIAFIALFWQYYSVP